MHLKKLMMSNSDSYMQDLEMMNMEKHASKDDMIKNFENLLAKINALEVSAKDDYQRSVIKVLRMLTEGQIHSINEFDHLKKAIDLLTLQLFDVKNKS